MVSGCVGLVTLLVVSSTTMAIAEMDPAELAGRLNEHRSVTGSDEDKAWPVLVGPLRALPLPPDEIGGVTAATIWPGMPGWESVAKWAADNPDLGAAIRTSATRAKIGLLYGASAVDAGDVDLGLYVDIGARDGRTVRPTFPYLQHIRRMSAWVTAEAYRRMEAGQIREGLGLLVDQLFVLRLVADREFLGEKVEAIKQLNESLRVFRGVIYRYMDQIPGELLVDIGLHELPYLRPDRARLFIPEHDRLVCEILLEHAFHERTGTARADAFPQIFTDLQAENEPLSRFGARRRWEWLQSGHDSLEASRERLGLIYDDWWRRWRADKGSDLGRLIQTEQSQFETVNTARFAAIVAAIRDMRELFSLRDELLMQTYGTATAVGLAAYRNERGVYPNQIRYTYGLTMNKRRDHDVWDSELSGFLYRFSDKKRPLDVGPLRVWIPEDMGLLYSVGRNAYDEFGVLHLVEEGTGDYILWPPPAELIREQAPKLPGSTGSYSGGIIDMSTDGVADWLKTASEFLTGQ